MNTTKTFLVGAASNDMVRKLREFETLPEAREYLDRLNREGGSSEGECSIWVRADKHGQVPCVTSLDNSEG